MVHGNFIFACRSELVEVERFRVNMGVVGAECRLNASGSSHVSSWRSASVHIVVEGVPPLGLVTRTRTGELGRRLGLAAQRSHGFF